MKPVELVKAGSGEGGRFLLNALGVICVISLFLFVAGFLPIHLSGNAPWQAASLESYEYVAGLTEEFPELRDEIERCKEDGIISRWEVETLRKRAERIRKDRKLEKIK